MTWWVIRLALTLAVLMALVVGAAAVVGRQLDAPQLAYITDEVMLYDVRVGASMPLTNELSGNTFVKAWSRDGRYLALNYWKEGEYALALLDTAAPRSQNFYRFDDYLQSNSVSWSPDSKHLLMVTVDQKNGGERACVLSVEDLQWTCPPLDIRIRDAVWSPRDDVWAVKYSDGDQTCVGLLHVDTLRLEPYECGFSYTTPLWNGDGTRLIYIRYVILLVEDPPSNPYPRFIVQEIDVNNAVHRSREYSLRLWAFEERLHWHSLDQVIFGGGATRIHGLNPLKYYSLDVNTDIVKTIHKDDYARVGGPLDYHSMYEARIYTSSVTRPELWVRPVQDTDWHTVSQIGSYGFAWRP